MATALVDDFDFTSPARTVRFGLGGKEWLDIELSEKHAAELEAALAPYIAAARKAGTPARDGGSRKTPPAASKSAPPPAASKPTSRHVGPPRIQAGTEYWVTPGGANAPYVTREQYKELRQRIRDWGNANGYPVAQTGRIPPELGDAYARFEGNAARVKRPNPQPALDDNPPPYAVGA